MKNLRTALILCACCLGLTTTRFASADFVCLLTENKTDDDTVLQCTGLTVCNVSIQFSDDNDRLLSVAFADVQVLGAPDAQFNQVFFGADTPYNCAFLENVPTLICDSYVAIGEKCFGEGGTTEDPDWNCDPDIEPCEGQPDYFNDLGQIFGGWFNANVNNGLGDAFNDINPDGKVLILQLAVAQGLTVQGTLHVFWQNIGNPEVFQEAKLDVLCDEDGDSSSCGCENDADCDDGDLCTDDVCGEDNLCSNTPIDCGDLDDECVVGVCVDGICEEQPSNEGGPCGDPSNTDCDDPDTCSAGVCQDNLESAGTSCTDDGNECTDDVCDGAGACTHPNEAKDTACGDQDDTECDDPDTCDGAGACQDNLQPPGSSCGDPSDSNCDDPDTCDDAGSCQDNAEPDGTSCDDGNACTVGDQCGGGSCQPGGEKKDCNDNDACTIDGCDPANGCTHEDVECNDDNDCTADDCDAVDGCIYTPDCMMDTDCDDGLLCTTDTCTAEGCCENPAVECPFGQVCNPDNGDCEEMPCKDDSECDDGNECTDDICDPAAGCTFPPNNNSCQDGNACTVGDQCDGGSCQPGGEKKDCNDDNACTIDGCDPASGCTYEDVDCNDDNDCTADDCDALDGCSNTPDCMMDTDCDDGLLCTTDTCTAEGCCENAEVECPLGGVCNPNTGDCGEITDVELHLDIKPKQCPNKVWTNTSEAVWAALLGTDDFDITQVRTMGIELRRADGVGQSLAPKNLKFKDEGTPFEGELCECWAVGKDQTTDLRMKFKADAMVEAFELDGLPSGTVVQLIVTGTLMDATPFFGHDCILIMR